MKKNQREWNGRLETKAVKAQQRLEPLSEGLTPFNTPYTPFSLKQFINIGGRHADMGNNCEKDPIANTIWVDYGLRLLEHGLQPLAWLGNTLNYQLLCMVPASWHQWELFLRMRNVFITMVTLFCFLIVSCMAMPFLIMLTIISAPVWSTGGIFMIAKFLSNRIDDEEMEEYHVGRYSRRTHNEY